MTIAEYVACLVLAALFIIQNCRSAAIDKQLAAILRAQRRHVTETRQQADELQRVLASIRTFCAREAKAVYRLHQIETGLGRIERHLDALQHSPNAGNQCCAHQEVQEERSEGLYSNPNVDAWRASTMRVPHNTSDMQGIVERDSTRGKNSAPADSVSLTKRDGQGTRRQKEMDKTPPGNAAPCRHDRDYAAGVEAREIDSSKSPIPSKRQGSHSIVPDIAVSSPDSFVAAEDAYTLDMRIYGGAVAGRTQGLPRISVAQGQSLPCLTVVAEEEPKPPSNILRSSSSTSLACTTRTKSTPADGRSFYFNEAPPTPLAPPSTPLSPPRSFPRTVSRENK